MTSTFTVFIDANVFFGARLRSLVIYFARSKMFRARWSERVHEEWMHNVSMKRSIPLAALAKTRADMDRALLDALVTEYGPLERSFTLPDPDDHHILAAAVKAGSDIILTFNLSDFPATVLEPFDLNAIHPDDFFLDLFGLSEATFIEGVKADFRHYKAPPLTFDRYIDDLRKAGVPSTAKLI